MTLAAASAASASAAVISRPGAATPLRAGAGWAAWSELDGAGGYRLTVRAPDGRVSRPDIAPSGRPIDLDIGTEADGSPVIVFNRCPPVAPDAEEGQDSMAHCAARALELTGGHRPIPVADVAVAGVPAEPGVRALAIWKGTVAWVEGDGSAPFVNRRLPTGQLQRMRVHPATLCSKTVEGRICRRPSSVRVQDIDLRGDLLAASLRYVVKGQYGLNTAALWLTNTRTGRQSEVGTVIGGLGGQSFVAPQFLDGRTLGYLLTCLSDPGGCSRLFGEYRLDMRTQRTTFRRDQIPHTGWGSVGAGLLLAPSPDACIDGVSPRPDIGTCTVRLVPAPRYVRAPALRLQSQRSR